MAAGLQAENESLVSGTAWASAGRAAARAPSNAVSLSSRGPTIQQSYPDGLIEGRSLPRATRASPARTTARQASRLAVPRIGLRASQGMAAATGARPASTLSSRTPRGPAVNRLTSPWGAKPGTGRQSAKAASRGGSAGRKVTSPMKAPSRRCSTSRTSTAMGPQYLEASTPCRTRDQAPGSRAGPPFAPPSRSSSPFDEADRRLVPRSGGVRPSSSALLPLVSRPERKWRGRGDRLGVLMAAPPALGAEGGSRRRSCMWRSRGAPSMVEQERQERKEQEGRWRASCP